MSTPESLEQQIKKSANDMPKGKSWPPVEKWNPVLSGDMDMRIDREGRWFHQGDEITRKSLVKLFSSILKREENDYFLVTPVEKWRISVEVAPYAVVLADKEMIDGQEVIVLFTQLGDRIELTDPGQLWVKEDEQGNPLPLIVVRSNLTGLIGRQLFYQLVEWAEPRDKEGKQELVLTSAGNEFSLGFY